MLGFCLLRCRRGHKVHCHPGKCASAYPGPRRSRSRLSPPDQVRGAAGMTGKGLSAPEFPHSPAISAKAGIQGPKRPAVVAGLSVHRPPFARASPENRERSPHASPSTAAPPRSGRAQAWVPTCVGNAGLKLTQAFHSSPRMRGSGAASPVQVCQSSPPARG